MSDSALRLIAILQKIPRYPRKVGLSDIRSYLHASGFHVTDRTIQRDLIKLSGLFEIQSDERSRPFGWSFGKDARVLLPNVNPHEALTMLMASKFLKNYIPPAVMEYLKPLQYEAKDIIEKTNINGMATWTNKVAHVPRGFQLHAANVEPGIIATVYSALLDEKKLGIDYKDKASQKINPLGLVVRDQIIYLICTFWSFEKPLQLALHRIKKALILDEKSSCPDSFSLKSFIKDGDLNYKKSNDALEVTVHFTHAAVKHLYETPLSLDQKIEVISDTKVKVTAIVNDTKDFRWWLLGFGAQVEVIAPEFLREEFKKIAVKMNENYKN
jgi:predicted DNA-binding transcriptional regulator YafY